MTLQACNSATSQLAQWLAHWLALAGVLLLCGCGSMGPKFDPAAIAPLQYQGQLLTVSDAMTAEPAPDLLAVNDDMRAFVEEYTAGIHNPLSRMMALHTAVKSPGALGMQYDPFADGSAQQAFQRGSANCLSYASMFIALAREAGLQARYQWVDIRPEWSRIGERVALRLHVNVLVRTRDGDEFMVDIDPLQRRQVASARPISDREAAALFHSNRAMQHLSDEDIAAAWLQLVRALQLAPELPHLWVNLGAIYRHAEQYADAERYYFHALSLDRSDRSAMNNLVVLYGMTGRADEEAYWMDRLTRYRDRNPYFHAYQGDIAAAAGDWEAAFEHYSKAVELQPEDSELIYGLAIVQHRRGNFDAATRLIETAIERANFGVDEVNYRNELKALKEERAAAL
jgi:Flp pilus assembly protein TadD